MPLDPESGLPKPLNANGHANGYGGWEADDTDDGEGYEMPGSSMGLLRDNSIDLDGRSRMP